MLFAKIGKSKDSCHDMEVIVDPEHSKELTQPLINYALNHIKNNTDFDLNTITLIRKTDENLLGTLKSIGFEVFETDHILGLKFKEEI
ncbi:MAG: hypothetical protein ACTSPC_14405 [Candidatus Heimdallarchaeota archaeon]